jgi:hypothetical protein
MQKNTKSAVLIHTQMCIAPSQSSKRLGRAGRLRYDGAPEMSHLKGWEISKPAHPSFIESSVGWAFVSSSV